MRTWLYVTLVASMAFAFASLTFQPASARDVVLVFSQLGQASENNKQQAHDEAYQSAVDALNNMCVGTMQNIVETGTTYIPIGSGDDQTFSAMVFVRGQCVIHGR